MGAPTTFAYLTRCIPALSVCCIATLLVFSFLVEPYGRGEAGSRHGTSTTWQLLLSSYTVLLHIMSIAFPARVCYALGDIIKNLREHSKLEDDGALWPTAQTIKTEHGAISFPAPLFVIILPAYKEEMSTLEETLRVLAAHPQARHSYHVYLAMEQKEEKSSIKAQTLIESFEYDFYRMSYTVHPSGIPGEAQGKSSNESWAAKQASRDYADEEVKEHVVITVMDADTHLSPRYFQQIARLHNDLPETRDTTCYVPPLVFDRNLHHVPLPVRTADLMWAGAGLSSLYQGSGVCIPTSVYSLPMVLVERVGGWDTDPGAIGEDMHMYLKCFFALSGNLTNRVIYAAASQCNVSSDKHGLMGYVDGLHARYKQALRHMWGAMDTGFAIRESVKMFKRHWSQCSNQEDLPLSAPNSNWTAFYTSTGLHKSLAPKSAEMQHPPLQAINVWNVITIYLRLFEAHFLPIHLVVILTTSSIFTLLTPGFLVPEVLRVALDFSGWCRLAGWLLMLLFFYRMGIYHDLCVGLRKEEMYNAGLLDEMVANDGFTHSMRQTGGFWQFALFPLGGFIYGAIPALQAVLSHVFTDRLTYVVSLKPQLALKQFQRGATPCASFQEQQQQPPPPPQPSKPASSSFSSSRASKSRQWAVYLEQVANTWLGNRPVKQKD